MASAQIDQQLPIILNQTKTPIQTPILGTSPNEYEELFNYVLSLNDQKPEETYNEKFNCIYCNSFDTVKPLHGTLVCVRCGSETNSDICDELECQYSGLNSDDNSMPSRTGLVNNQLLFRSNFIAKITGNKTSINIKKINNVWENLVHKERTLFKIFKKISDKCRQNGIPNNVVQHSQVLYKQVYDIQKTLPTGKGSRKDNLEGLIASCIYYSCKLHNINRSHQEIANICDIDKKSVSLGCKLFFSLMHNKINLNNNTTNYHDFLERFSSHLQLTDHELRLVTEICDNVQTHGLLNDNKPWTIASVCIYMTNILYNFGIDRKLIAEQCETTEGTLDKHFSVLMENVDKLIV